jgi:predicted RNase H-like nuclease
MAAPLVVGVDGCRNAWLAVSRAPDTSLDLAIVDDAAALLERYASAAVIALDLPLGLSDHGPRTADTLARRRLGRGRASSVFATPLAAIIDAPTRLAADQRRRVIDGRGVGAQSFHLFTKIADWRRALLASPGRERVYEIHPEVSFAELAGAAIVASKHTPDGARIRRDLLAAHYGEAAVAALEAALPRRRAGIDDLYDALAALWSASRIAAGDARSLPDPPERDAAGLRRAISI